MPIYELNDEVLFPPVDHAEEGLLAVGGDLRPERLLQAYAEGIFPWPHDDYPLLWFSPDPRFVLRTEQPHIGRSLRKVLRAERFRISMDTAFERVIRACAEDRDGRGTGTWITAEMIDAYTELHRQGFAHSVEAWFGDELAGGLYGVCLGGCFTGESMFSARSNASKVAFVWLARQCARWHIGLIDCQTESEHMRRFGAQPWPRAEFVRALGRSNRLPTRRGRWRFDDGFDAQVVGAGSVA